MSRVQENSEIISKVKSAFSGTPEQVMCGIEAQKLGLLADISKSLAVIADSLNNKEIDDGK